MGPFNIYAFVFIKVRFSHPYPCPLNTITPMFISFYVLNHFCFKNFGFNFTVFILPPSKTLHLTQ